MPTLPRLELRGEDRVVPAKTFGQVRRATKREQKGRVNGSGEVQAISRIGDVLKYWH